MDAIAHCIAKIHELVDTAEPVPTRRTILQLGYNLGRLSELTGQGRAPYWDAWKDPVQTWNLSQLQNLCSQLRVEYPNDPRA